jgi:hypothetical protein
LQLPSLALQQSICGTSNPQNNHCNVTVTTYIVCTMYVQNAIVCTMYVQCMYNVCKLWTMYVQGISKHAMVCTMYVQCMNMVHA